MAKAIVDIEFRNNALEQKGEISSYIKELRSLLSTIGIDLPKATTQSAKSINDAIKSNAVSIKNIIQQTAKEQEQLFDRVQKKHAETSNKIVRTAEQAKDAQIKALFEAKEASEKVSKDRHESASRYSKLTTQELKAELDKQRAQSESYSAALKGIKDKEAKEAASSLKRGTDEQVVILKNLYAERQSIEKKAATESARNEKEAERTKRQQAAESTKIARQRANEEAKIAKQAAIEKAKAEKDSARQAKEAAEQLLKQGAAEKAARIEAEAVKHYAGLEAKYRRDGLDATRAEIHRLESTQRAVNARALQETEKYTQKELALRSKAIGAQLQQLRSIEKSQTGGRTFTEQLENAGLFSKLPGGSALSQLISTTQSLKLNLRELATSGDSVTQSQAAMAIKATLLTGVVAGLAATVYGAVKAFNFIETEGRKWDDALDRISIALTRSTLSGAALRDEQARLIHNAPLIADAYAKPVTEILSLQATIVGFSGITGSTLDRLTDLSIGIAAATGMQAEQVARMIAKATDPENEAQLRKLGIVFKDNMNMRERMDEIEKRFAESIQATKDATKDAYGEYDRAKNKLGEVIEKMSNKVFAEFAPIFTKANLSIDGFAKTLEHDVIPFVRDSVKVISELNQAGNQLGAWYEKLLNLARGAGDAVNKAWRSIPGPMGLMMQSQARRNDGQGDWTTDEPSAGHATRFGTQIIKGAETNLNTGGGSKTKPKTLEQIEKEEFDKRRQAEEVFHAMQLANIQAARNRNEITERQAEQQRVEEERKHYRILLGLAELYRQDKSSYMMSALKLEEDERKKAFQAELNEVKAHQTALLQDVLERESAGKITSRQAREEEYQIKKQFLESEIAAQRDAGYETDNLQNQLLDLERSHSLESIRIKEDDKKRKEQIDEAYYTIRADMADSEEQKLLRQEELRFQKERWKFQDQKEILELLEKDHWRRMAQIQTAGANQYVGILTNTVSTGLQGGFNVINKGLFETIDKSLNSENDIGGAVLSGLFKGAVTAAENAVTSSLTNLIKVTLIGEAVKSKIKEIENSADPNSPNIRIAAGMLGGGGDQASASVVNGLSGFLLGTLPAQGFASGGVNIIGGVGTGTSDSNIIRVSKGESIINADSTAKYGSLLTLINNDSLPGFAEGGVGLGQEVLRSVVGPANTFMGEGGNPNPTDPHQKELQRHYKEVAKQQQKEAEKAARKANDGFLMSLFRPMTDALEGMASDAGDALHEGAKDFNTSAFKVDTQSPYSLPNVTKTWFSMPAGGVKATANTLGGTAALISDNTIGTHIGESVENINKSIDNLFNAEHGLNAVLMKSGEIITSGAQVIGTGASVVNSLHSAGVAHAAMKPFEYAANLGMANAQHAGHYNEEIQHGNYSGLATSVLLTNTAALTATKLELGKFKELAETNAQALGVFTEKALPALAQSFGANHIVEGQFAQMGLPTGHSGGHGGHGTIEAGVSGEDESAAEPVGGHSTNKLAGHSVVSALIPGLLKQYAEQKKLQQENNDAQIKAEQDLTKQITTEVQQREEKKNEIVEQGNGKQSQLTTQAYGIINNVTSKGLDQATGYLRDAFGQQNAITGAATGMMVDSLQNAVGSMIQSYMLDLTTKQSVEVAKQAIDVESTAVKVTSDRAKDASTLASTAVTTASVGPTVAAESAKQGSTLLTAVSDLIAWFASLGPLGLVAGIAGGIGVIYGIYKGAKALFKFKEGGVVDQPQNFLFGKSGQFAGQRGEAGKEAIIPLAKLPGLMVSMGYIPAADVINRSYGRVQPQSQTPASITQAVKELGDRLDKSLQTRPAPIVIDQHKNILSQERTKRQQLSTVLG